MALLGSLLTACQSHAPSPVLDGGYSSARAQSTLEIPPDLVGQTSSEIKSRTTNRTDSTSPAVLPTLEGVRMESNGTERFLVASADTDTTWAKLMAYVDHTQLPVLAESQQEGILETDWIGVAGTDTATQRWLRRYIKGLASRPALNDKYTFWLERLSDSETAIHITHKQLVKHVIEPKNPHENIEVEWQEKDGDPATTLEMLRKLQSWLGSS